MKYFYIFLIYPLLLSGQSEYLNSDYSGVTAGGAFSTSNIFNSSGGNIGLSILGMVDFGVEYISSSSKNSNDYKLESSASLVYLGYNIKRKNDTSNLRLLIGLLNSSNISGLALGLAFSVRVYENENFILLPGVGFLYGFLSVPESTNYSPFYYNKNNSYILNSRSLALDINLITKITRELLLIASPSVSKDLVNSKNSLAIGIYGGLMFSFPNNLNDSP